MNPLTAALEFIDSINQEETPEGVSRRLSDLGNSFGFPQFCLAAIPDPGVSFDGSIILSGWSPEWQKRYLDRDYVQNDPLVAQARTAVRPFLWSSVARDRELSAMAQQILADARNYGMNDGVCVPIHGLQGYQGVLLLGGPEVRLTEREISVLHLVGIYASNKMRELTGANANRPRHRLTPRELECLKWSAAGKTSWEISQILNISQHTADWYLASAARKLHAANRTHAVAEGFRLGLIR
ncbi:LuxR family transcriptional regulator [Rhodobacteraceae bacterium RKSG542]|uniref:LuxR family transcriptional regulator n=1 Tax=Pseudovibrio flavus TaxID=2529854 RepID=UPI0012BB8080|nr:LuxR family transcriptional regulator [Pseudovibrio flavus]MTI16867.1 LuxR family transcriptional regulator [Pseudovibrio flavus]